MCYKDTFYICLEIIFLTNLALVHSSVIQADISNDELPIPWTLVMSWLKPQIRCVSVSPDCQQTGVGQSDPAYLILKIEINIFMESLIIKRLTHNQTKIYHVNQPKEYKNRKNGFQMIL